MPDQKISAFPAATSIAATDVLDFLQSGANKRMTVAQLADLVSSIIGAGGGGTPSVPSVTVSDVTVNENNGTMVFTVTRTGTITGTSTVNYATANGTATAGTDYTTTAGTLTFNANETVKTVSVTILDDSTVESSESILLNLTAGTNVTIGDAQAIGTITDNDVAAPTGTPGLIITADYEVDHDDLAMTGVGIGMHRAGMCNILAMISDVRVPAAPGAMRSLLNYSNLSSVPVGAYKGTSGGTGSSWSPTIAAYGGYGEFGIADFPSEVAVMRQALVSAPSNNNIIAIMGSAGPTAALMQSPADGISPLTGAQLFAAKVSRVVMMGGSFSGTPTTSTYNIGQNKAAAEYMYANMGSVPLWFGSGSETQQASCGPELTDDPVLNPYRAGFAVATDPVNAQGKRVAYDPVTLYFAIVGPESAMFDGIKGTQTINAANAGTTWVQDANGPHTHLDIVGSTTTLGQTLDAFIAQAYTAPYTVAAPTVRTPSVTGSDVTFDWDMVNGATGYEVQIDGGAWQTLSIKTRKISGVAVGAHSGRIRGIRPGPTPGTASASFNFTIAGASPSVAAIFSGGAQGVWIDIDPAYCFTDRAGTVPATVGGVVGCVKDRSGGNNHMVAITDADAFILRNPSTGKYRLEGDGTKKGYDINGATTDYAQVHWVMRVQQKTATNWQTWMMKLQSGSAHTSPFQRWGLANLNAGQPSVKTNGNAITLATVANQFTNTTTISVDCQSAVVLKDGAAYGDGTDTPSQSYPTAAQPIRVGSNGAGGEALNGFIDGLIIVNRSLTSDELTLVSADVAQT